MADSSTTASTGIDNRSQLITAAIVLLSQSWLSVSLRMFVRIKLTKSFDLDDWLIVLSQLIYTLLCVFFLESVHYGLGLHDVDISIENQTLALKYQILATLHYIASMLFVKLSIAFFLLRIAIQRPYAYAIKASMVIITLWSIAIFFYYIFLCSPVEAQWDRTISNSKCQPGRNFFVAAYSLGGMSVTSDWFYALLPVPIILSLQMSLRVKLTLCFVLSLGVLSSVAGIIRLASLANFASGTNHLFNTTQTMIWTLVEPGAAIVAASLVTIRPLLRALRFRGFESAQTAPRASNFGGSYGHQLTTREGFEHLADGNSRSSGGAFMQGKNANLQAGNTGVSAERGTERVDGMARSRSVMDRLKGREVVYGTGAEQGNEERDMEMGERMAGGGEGGIAGREEQGIVRTVDVRVESMRVSGGGNTGWV